MKKNMPGDRLASRKVKTSKGQKVKMGERGGGWNVEGAEKIPGGQCRPCELCDPFGVKEIGGVVGPAAALRWPPAIACQPFGLNGASPFGSCENPACP